MGAANPILLAWGSSPRAACRLARRHAPLEHGRGDRGQLRLVELAEEKVRLHGAGGEARVHGPADIGGAALACMLVTSIALTSSLFGTTGGTKLSLGSAIDESMKDFRRERPPPPSASLAALGRRGAGVASSSSCDSGLTTSPRRFLASALIASVMRSLSRLK